MLKTNHDPASLRSVRHNSDIDSPTPESLRRRVLPVVRASHRLWIVALVFPLFLTTELYAADASELTKLAKRVPWTTSRIQGTPEPPSPYQTSVAFPKIRFFEPLAMATIPGTNRLAVAERPGRILSWKNDAQVEQADVMLDVKHTVYGLAFHPRFSENGFLYVMYLVDAANPTDDGSRVARFTVTDRERLTADLSSEKVLLTWPSGGHNGGCLRFGPDGYLYVATGDGSGIADELQTGQKLDDLLGAILRIDVNGESADRPYKIPVDNPFRETPGARPELYSYGHRQVWRFSFDRSGRLWAGEVGQDLWEMVYLVQKGGNYGWSVQEGSHPFRPERPLGPTPILPPLKEHSHADFRSITGGYIYESKRLPELKGAYIYGDYDTGRVWSLRYDGQQVTESRELVDTQFRIVEFGQDPAGEVYLVDFVGGQLHRLDKAAPATTETADFPRKLSETGIYRSTREMIPEDGVIPYSVNAELWSDGAVKERFLALPGDSRIEFDTVLYPQGAPGAEPGWRFPHDAVLVKTFSLDMEVGNPQSRRRLETRILHHKHMPGTEEYGDQYWRGYTYVWNDEQTDAELLDTEGLTRTYTIRDPQAPGGEREQTWRFPSRAECTLCHTMAAKYALGVNTSQLNKIHKYGDVSVNQLAALEQMGVFTKPLPKRPDQLARLVDYHDEEAPLPRRARSYLQANCAHCHRKWGGGNAEFQLVAGLPLQETGTVGTRPGQGTFDLSDPKILLPGEPTRSLIYHRMQKLGLGRMPHIASNVVDQQGIDLIRQWIKQLPRDGQEDAGLIVAEE